MEFERGTDTEMLDWDERIDNAKSREERLRLINEMPKDVAARWVEWVHPTYGGSVEPETNSSP